MSGPAGLTPRPEPSPTGLLRGPWTWQKVTALPLLVVVRAYQLVLSPLTGPSCRFYPSCSSYAVTALVRFGPLRGGWLALRRLARCHPWNAGGVDHVPPAGGRLGADSGDRAAYETDVVPADPSLEPRQAPEDEVVAGDLTDRRVITSRDARLI